MNQGIYPQNFKCAQVTPIHETGTENVCTNYRPISVLSPLNKIFEKLLYDRLYHYVECKSMLSKHHYGFRTKVSTEFAIYGIVECILETWTRKYQLVQFSLISHKLLILLTILCCCGSWNITMAFEGSHYNFLKIIYIGENNIQ